MARPAFHNLPTQHLRFILNRPKRQIKPQIFMVQQQAIISQRADPVHDKAEQSLTHPFIVSAILDKFKKSRNLRSKLQIANGPTLQEADLHLDVRLVLDILHLLWRVFIPADNIAEQHLRDDTSFQVLFYGDNF